MTLLIIGIVLWVLSHTFKRLFPGARALWETKPERASLPSWPSRASC